MEWTPPILGILNSVAIIFCIWSFCETAEHILRLSKRVQRLEEYVLKCKERENTAPRKANKGTNHGT
jgi:hypothetical protein